MPLPGMGETMSGNSTTYKYGNPTYVTVTVLYFVIRFCDWTGSLRVKTKQLSTRISVSDDTTVSVITVNS